MKEKNKSKTLKGQLFGAISMMLVAAIALGTSTYAWFINNNTVAVDPMQLSVTTSTSLTVAVGKKASFADATVDANWTPYKTVISNDDIKGAVGDASKADWADMFKNPMAPASVTTANLGGKNGAVAPKFFMSNGHIATNLLDEFTPLAKGVNAMEAGQGPVKIIPMRFMASQDINVYFGRATSGEITALTNLDQLIVAKKSIKTGADQTTEQAIFDAQAAAIKKALKVAVVPHATAAAPYNTVVPVAFQFDAGTDHLQGGANNTKYQVNGPTTTANETTGVYAAVASLGTTAGPGKGYPVATDAELKALLPGLSSATGTSGDYIATVVAGTDNNPATVTKGTKELFALKANQPLDVDVYIWLEGTDMDCISTLSAYGFSLDLPFAGVAPVAVP